MRNRETEQYKKVCLRDVTRQLIDLLLERMIIFLLISSEYIVLASFVEKLSNDNYLPTVMPLEASETDIQAEEKRVMCYITSAKFAT